MEVSHEGVEVVVIMMSSNDGRDRLLVWCSSSTGFDC